MNKNTSHLAGEFLVAGELARRGLSVAITFGNAKSVDIFAKSSTTIYSIDAKAIRKKTNWPIARRQIDPKVFYVLVYLGSATAVSNNIASEFFIVAGDEILENRLIGNWQGGRSGIEYGRVQAYRNAWGRFK